MTIMKILNWHQIFSYLRMQKIPTDPIHQISGFASQVSYLLLSHLRCESQGAMATQVGFNTTNIAQSEVPSDWDMWW